MCEFISWIEKENKVYYLTSSDLASKRGRQLIKHTQREEDLVGHGAIRWFYGGFKGGTDKECTDFSSPNNFPKEIVEDIKLGKFKGMGICKEALNPSTYEEYKKTDHAAYKEYNNVEQTAYEEYGKIRQSAYEEYRKIRQNAIEQNAYEEYQKISQSAFEEYKKIEQPAYEEYEKIEQSAYKEYRKIEQKIFWKIFADLTNRKEEWR